MVRGSRHSKNAGTMGSEAITYAEKRALGYGTVAERLGKESTVNFWDCRLTLQPARDPVCTPLGIVYGKEDILECLLRQKEKIKRKLKTWLDFHRNVKSNTYKWMPVKAESNLEDFTKSDNVIEDKNTFTNTLCSERKSCTLDKKTLVYGGVATYSNQKILKSFWVDGETDSHWRGFFSRRKAHSRPNSYTICPTTGEKLELKDLISLKFNAYTSATENSSVSQYVDPITKDPLTNRSNLLCIRPTGDVVLLKTYITIIEPSGIYANLRLKKKDIIVLKKGGTGFANHDGKTVIAREHSILGFLPTLTDLRGQHSGSGAKSGLVIF